MTESKLAPINAWPLKPAASQPQNRRASDKREDISQKPYLLVEGVRLFLLMLVLLIIVVSQIFQKYFFNFSVVLPMYFAMAAFFLFHFVYVLGFEKWGSSHLFLAGSFFIDTFLISVLTYYTGMNQSMFLFMYLVNIILSGLIFQTRGSIYIALVSSILFTGLVILSPDIKSPSTLFLLAFNNIAFFSVAALSGYLSEQINFMGERLAQQGFSLRKISNLNNMILNHAPIGIMTISEMGEVAQVNSFGEGILKTPVLDQNIYQLLPGLKEKIAQSAVSFDFEIKTVEGENQILRFTTGMLSTGEISEKASILMFEDQTKMRELEYAVRQSEKMAAVGQLAAGIAHEIRNPLASISGSIQMLSGNATSSDDKKLMNIVLKEIDRLNNLITEFLDYARPDQPPKDKVDLTALLGEILNMLKVNTQLRAEVVQTSELSPAIFILGHRDKLKQAFLNIMINSYQAMEKVDNATLDVKLFVQDHSAVLLIADTGSGMSEQTRKKMFEPFHTTKPKGTGLGLAVTHKILENHHAKIFVESEVGQGTQFKIEFPVLQES